MNSIGIDELLNTYGSCNDLREKDGLSGDRRSMSTTDALSAALEALYTPDVLSGKTLFTGISLATIPSDQPVHYSIKDNLDYISYLRSQVAAGVGSVSQTFLTYKVLIPEIDPRNCLDVTKGSKGMTLAQRINTLPTAVIGGFDRIEHTQQFIKPGTLVDIIFENEQRRIGPKIVKMGPQVFDINFKEQSVRSSFDRPPTLQGAPDTNPGVERVLRGSQNTRWGDDPSLQEMLEVLNDAAESEGIYLTSTSAYRAPYDQARIMLDNYQSKGGRSYLVGLYGSATGKPTADIFDMRELSREQKIQKAVRDVPYMSRANHVKGNSLDIRFGFTTNGKRATAGPTPPPRVTKVVAAALQKMSIKVLVEGDHYHLTALSSTPGGSSVAYKTGNAAVKSAAASGGLPAGDTTSVET